MRIRVPGLVEPIRPGKIIGIGRNYAAHAAEMNWPAAPEPVFFLKPSSALIPSGGDVVLPPGAGSVNYEAELVIVIGASARRVTEAEAMSRVAGYALGLDVTARDQQLAAKKAGDPWSQAKGFDTFAPLGPITPANEAPSPADMVFELRQNGQLRQRGVAAEMISSVPRLISALSRTMTLEPGDLIYTGTPEGVGPLSAGDTLEVTGAGLESLTVGVRTG